MSVTVRRNSRLRFGHLATVDGFEFWDLLELPEIPIQEDDLQYQVLGSDRIDRLATQFYGNSVLWWVIALANDMEILPTDLVVGDVIRIPSPRYVNQQLFKGLSTGF